MMKRKKDNAFLVLLLLAVLTVVACAASAVIKKQLRDAVVIPTMVCDRYFVPMDFAPEDSVAEIALQFVREGSELPGLEYNTKYPCYQNNGATIFLYEGNYNMVFADFSEAEGEPYSLAGGGTVFDQETSAVIGAQVHLLRMVDTGLCVNLEEFVLHGEINAVIPKYSLIQLQKNNIRWYEYYRGRLRYQNTVVTPNTRVTVGQMNSTYYEWLASWEREDIGAPPAQEKFTDALYFYDMCQQFEIQGESMFRRAEGKQLLLDNKSVLYNVHGLALYYEDENAVILPSGFGIMQPWSKRVNSLPQLTKLVPDIGAVYLEMPERVLGMNDAFVYSEAGCYIFLDATEFVMGDFHLGLEPLSMVMVEDHLSLSVYQYQTKEFSTYTVSGPVPYVDLGHGLKLRPLQGSLEWSDRTNEVLIATPSILPVLQ